MQKITMADCRNLYKRFKKYTETAEQHEFALLFKIDMMMQYSLFSWSEPINQKEARSMFRIVGKYIGEDITPYLE